MMTSCFLCCVLDRAGHVRGHACTPACMHAGEFRLSWSLPLPARPASGLTFPQSGTPSSSIGSARNAYRAPCVPRPCSDPNSNKNRASPNERSAEIADGDCSNRPDEMRRGVATVTLLGSLFFSHPRLCNLFFFLFSGAS